VNLRILLLHIIFSYIFRLIWAIIRERCPWWRLRWTETCSSK